ncbi:MAG: two-component system sensor histidine kinase CreC [Opitutae bacterium]|nr:two-component system sensor histidine kinase CreC [Opitutae bacterium]
MKIRTAIFGVYGAASAVGFAVLMGFVLREVRPRYVESMRRTLNDTAAIFAAMIEADLAQRPETAPAAALGAAWRAHLAAVEKAAGGLRVYVTDAKGVVAFDSAGGRDVGRDYTRRPEMSAYFEKSDYAADNVSVVAGELRVTAPVRWREATVGFVGVARPLASVTEAIFRARVRLVAGSLAVAAVMVAAGWWLAAKLTHSLERLTVYAQAVRDGHAATPPGSRATEIAALTRAFEEMRTTLEGKAYVERYTHDLAHEIKAPLSAIRGAAELLEENPPEADRAKFLGNIQAEAARIRHIVDRLLELAALESRHGRVFTREFDLAELGREIVASAQSAAKARGVTLISGTGPALRVRGESFMLGQALTNLVHNALEFTPSGGTVRLQFEPGAGGVAVATVEDTGPGIPDYALGKIFDRFYSLPRPDTGRKSTGLGLAIVREIMRLHGGDVRVTNRAEGGVRAELRLPAATANPGAIVT